MTKSTKQLAKELGLIRKRPLSATPTKVSKKRLKNDQTFAYLIVIDFESTCWENDKLKPQEIIEFPAVLLNTSTGHVEDEFHYYLQPSEQPFLSGFCKNLTGISQDTVDNGIPLSMCLRKFCAWLRNLNKTKGIVCVDDRTGMSNESTNGRLAAIVTWSDWDLGVCLFYEAKRKQITRPTAMNCWIDLRATYRKFYQRRPEGLNGALKELGIEFDGREHSGLDDARNTARLAWKMMLDGCIMAITKILKMNMYPGKTSVLTATTGYEKSSPKLNSPNRNGPNKGKPSFTIREDDSCDTLVQSQARDGPAKVGLSERKTNCAENKSQETQQKSSVCTKSSPRASVNLNFSQIQNKSVMQPFKTPRAKPVLANKRSSPSCKENSFCKTKSPIQNGNSSFIGRVPTKDGNHADKKPLNIGQSKSPALLKAVNFVHSSTTGTSKLTSHTNLHRPPTPTSTPGCATQAMQKTSTLAKTPCLSGSTNHVKNNQNNVRIFKTPSPVTTPRIHKQCTNTTTHSSFKTPESPSSRKATPLATPLAHNTKAKNQPCASHLSTVPRNTPCLNNSFKTPSPNMMVRNGPTTENKMRATPPLCKCGRRSRRRQVQNCGPNMGRLFFSCSMGRAENAGSSGGRGGCGFFQWDLSVT